jgi:sulfoxide reductase heme-binding subunit YedZ
MTAAIAGLKDGHVAEPLWQLKLIWPTMVRDVEKRRFIQVGLLAWVILLALAVTSPTSVLRAMGGTAWRRVHQLIYVAGVAAVIHYWWLVKTGVRSPLLPTLVLMGLLLARVGFAAKKRVSAERMAAARVSATEG